MLTRNKKTSTKMSIAHVMARFDSLEANLNKKFEDLTTQFGAVLDRVNGFEARIVALEEQAQSFSALKEKYTAVIKKTENAGVMAEFKSRELNVVLGNITQESKDEHTTVSLQKANDVLENVFKIQEPVEITHAHRLPVGGSENCRPLIIKVKSMMEKDKLWRAIGNVAKYNKDIPDDEKEKRRYVEMMDLPKKLFKDKAET